MEMKVTQARLISEYGRALADKAWEWFTTEHSSNFRMCIRCPYQYIVDNEYMWRN